MHRPSAEVWDEVAYLAYHLHWGMDGLLDLEHHDRDRLVDAVATLNDRAWERARELA